MASKKQMNGMKSLYLLLGTVFAMAIGLFIFTRSLNVNSNVDVDASGFDDYGYNYKARIFNGPLDGADRNNDGTYWGDPTYANDRLVMKWSKAWDDARFNGKPWGPDAWIDNEYNGRVPGGSGEVWHYKIVWVGPELEESPYWREGGYPIWGQFEVIFSQGSSAGNQHAWEVRSNPAGYGVFK